ncbi:MAG: DivIVA domain-containing protein, partial [Gaiellaceae bacterium]
MTITPVELHHVDLPRSWRGYRCKPVDQLLEDVACSFEEVWRERAEFADRIEQLEG